MKKNLMGYEITSTQKKIVASIQMLCENELNSHVFEEDQEGIFNYEKWKKVTQHGLVALPFPEEFSGLEADMMTTVRAIRALAYHCMDEGLVFSVCAQIAANQIPLWLYGSKEQKENYLKPICEGKLIGASVISEPNAGSDTGDLRTYVEATQDSYILNGVKTFATLGSVADIIVVYAKHKNGLRMLDTSAFLLKKGEYKVGQIFHKTGLRTSPMCEIILDQVVIPKDRIIGKERRGMKIFLDAMLWEKILVSAYHLGAMEQQYGLVYEYAKQRKQFGHAIIENQSIYHKLVEMKIRIETCRQMLFRTADQFDQGKIEKQHAAMLKLYSSECKLKNSLDSVALMGAYGIVQEGMIEKQMRDSLCARHYSGTNEMQERILLDTLGDYYED